MMGPVLRQCQHMNTGLQMNKTAGGWGDGVRATAGCDVVIDKVAFHGMCVYHMAERLTVGLVGEAFSYGLVLNRGKITPSQ